MEIKKIKYLENKKSLLDEITNIFHSFLRAIIWWKIKICQKIADTSFKEVTHKIDILLIPEAKLDNTLPLNQFNLEGFTATYRLDIIKHGGGLMLSVREDIPSKLSPNVNSFGDIDNIFVEINIRSNNGLFQAPITLMLVLFKITQSI